MEKEIFHEETCFGPSKVSSHFDKMIGRGILASASILLGLLTVNLLSLAQTKQSPQPEILIVGTYHMANRGHDAYNIQADDVLSPKRQREIAQLIEVLSCILGGIAAQGARTYPPDPGVKPKVRVFNGAVQSIVYTKISSSRGRQTNR